MIQIPLALYIHIPWCAKKCPYCDFNSHPQRGEIPEMAYTTALTQELVRWQSLTADRPLHSIFIGGGTPSLLTPSTYTHLLTTIHNYFPVSPTVEITLEANPGTTDLARFAGFREAGINRLSLGIQSFQDDQLKTLGRIHDSKTACTAISHAKSAGFERFNLDLMYGLPNQTAEEALHDLQEAMSFNPPHLSWYHLTLEPNTYFARFPPSLPTDDTLADIQSAGEQYLAQQGFQHYEISAYAKPGFSCQHNRLYWEFGDYIGIGAGAHGKITHPNGDIIRYMNAKHPKTYLEIAPEATQETRILTEADIRLEYFLNALRLREPLPWARFTERTGLMPHTVTPLLEPCIQAGLLTYTDTHLSLTTLGDRFVNEVLLRLTP